MAASMAVLVTLLMVFSGLASVANANGGLSNHAAAPTTSSAAVSVPAKAGTSTSAPLVKSEPKSEQNLMQFFKDNPGMSKTAFLPNFATMSNFQTKNQPGEPSCYGFLTGCYAPAAMGLADYGASNTAGTLVPYVYNTTSYSATVTINSVSDFALLVGVNAFGMQLNTILTNVTIGTTTHNDTGAPNTFWTQNVPEYQPYNHQLTFLDNIWNFTNGSMSMANQVVTGSGQTADNEYYYDEYSTAITVAPPFTLQLFNNASVTSADDSPYGAISTNTSFGFQLTTPAGNPFTYALPNGTIVSSNDLFTTYDSVSFASVSTAATLPTPVYMVNGLVNTAIGIPYDAEIMLGGPGGGSDTTVWNISATMQLQYLNGAGTWQNIRAGWDVGSETGETSEGISEWWTTPGVVNLGPGPSIIYPLWDASGATSTAGDWAVKMTVNPSNAFVFMEVGPTYNVADLAWAPTPWSGDTMVYNLPPLGFVGSVMASNYDPVTFAIIAQGPKVITLVADATMGVYTPLYALNAAQLANISIAGTGTKASPYVLADQATGGTINASFEEYNDYLFPVFPGVLVANTNAYAQMNASGNFVLDFTGNWATIFAYYGFPAYENMQIQLYDVSNFSIVNSVITGWYYYAAGIGNTGEILMWNVTNSLVADNTFEVNGLGVMTYNAPYVSANNIFWGNAFLNSEVYMPYAANWPNFDAMFLGESGDTVYNNYFATPTTIWTSYFDFWDYSAQSYVDTFNVPYTTCTPNANIWNGGVCQFPVTWVNGFPLTGNYIDGTYSFVNWVGGNYYTNFPCTLLGGIGSIPYNDNGLITNGGDYLPLCGNGNPVEFQETGLPAGTPWTVTFAGMTESSVGLSYIDFEVPGGASYSYTVSTVGTYAPTVQAGTIAVPVDIMLWGFKMPGEVTQPVTFVNGDIPAISVIAPVPGFVTYGVTNFSVTFTLSGIPASEYANLEATVTIYNAYEYTQPTAWVYYTMTNSSALKSGPNSIMVQKADLSLPADAKTIGDLPYSAYEVFVSVGYWTTPSAYLVSTYPGQGVTFYRGFAQITSPTNLGTLYSGTPFTISGAYDWAKWNSATNATFTVTNTATSTVVDSLTQKLTSGDAGTFTAAVSLTTGNYSITLSFSTIGGITQYVNATPVSVTVVSTVTPIVYINATVTQYQNQTLGPVQAVGAILIVVGLAVGFLIGYLLLKMSRPKTPSPQTWSPGTASSPPPPGSP
jgi:thermopsin